MTAPADAELLALSDRLWGALNERDWDTMFSLCTEDVRLCTDPGWPGGGDFRGREEVMRFLGQFLEPWEDLRYERTEPPEILAGCVVERGNWVGSGRATGIEATLGFSIVVTMRDGRIASAHYFFDREKALAFARGGAD